MTRWERPYRTAPYADWAFPQAVGNPPKMKHFSNPAGVKNAEFRRPQRECACCRNVG